MAVIRVFEPALCCNTGVCGTDVDESLVRFTADLNAVKGEGVDIARANLATDPGAFAANPIAVAFVQTVGSAGLPLTVVDDITVLTGRYPTREELQQWAGVTPAMRIELPLSTAGGCGGSTGCC